MTEENKQVSPNEKEKKAPLPEEGGGEAMKAEKESRIEQGLFSYETVAEAEKAVTEVEKIRRLEKQLDYNKPKLVFALYQKLLEGKMLQTVEGYAYLYHLRQFLEGHREQLGSDIPGLPAELLRGDQEYKIRIGRLQNELRDVRKQKKKLLVGRTTMRIVVAFLAVALIAMLLIAAFSDSPNILNYERVLQDKYASWEMDLKERENAVREKELELKRE